MQAFDEFSNMPTSFWALVKFVSQEIGYTNRALKSIRTYSEREIVELLESHNMAVDMNLIRDVVDYSQLRADALNGFARENLMDAQSVREEFDRLYEVYCYNNLLCNLPMNKQKGEMKQIAYFTAIINILTECTIREAGLFDGTKGFNDDPRSLMYVVDDFGYVIGASSRRMDGAYPDIINPKIIWEVKEYYYTTTFGSRVADGVYETQLDGYELNDISARSRRPIKHILFIDGYKTWWEDGRSYLCRIIDTLNAGLVDEVIIGREVLQRWPEVLRSVL